MIETLSFVFNYAQKAIFNRREMNFFGNLKRLNIKFNHENVIVVTAVRIPLYVRFVASLGMKFNFCDCDGNDDLSRYDLLTFSSFHAFSSSFSSQLPYGTREAEK